MALRLGGIKQKKNYSSILLDAISCFLPLVSEASSHPKFLTNVVSQELITMNLWYAQETWFRLCLPLLRTFIQQHGNHNKKQIYASGLGDTI